MDERELRSEMLTIRLSVAEKDRVRQAGELKFNIEVSVATMARVILMEAVDSILTRGKKKKTQHAR